MYDILELNKKLLPELKEIAKQLNVKKSELLRKQDLIYKILDEQAIMATESKKAVGLKMTDRSLPMISGLIVNQIFFLNSVLKFVQKAEKRSPNRTLTQFHLSGREPKAVFSTVNLTAIGKQATSGKKRNL
jgi:hypothetical protein